MEKRLKRVAISTDFLVDSLKDRRGYTTNVPEDSSFIRLYLDEGGSSYWMVIHSEKFRPLQEAETIPKLEVTSSEFTETFK